MLDALKLRNITSSFKRHSIKRSLRPATSDLRAAVYGASALDKSFRLNAADYFFVFTRQVLPKMEEKIELQLLEKFKDRLRTVSEKKELMQAYYQRKDNVAKMTENEDVGKPEKKPDEIQVPASELGRVIANIDGEGLSYHTYSDIGRYTVFPTQHWKRMFPT